MKTATKEAEDNRIALLNAKRILGDYKDQSDNRLPGEKSVLYWLTRAVDQGLTKAINEFTETVKDIYS